jgi:hypothetical protein
MSGRSESHQQPGSRLAPVARYALGAWFVIACGAASGICSSGCSRSSEPTAVIMKVSGFDKDIKTVRISATLNGTLSKPIDEFTEVSPEYLLEFHAKEQGQLAMQLEGLTEDRIVRSTGRGSVELLPGQLQEVAIPLTVGQECPQGWCYESPIPRGDTVHGVWAFSPRDVWAVGNRGFFLKWDGTLWRPADYNPASHTSYDSITAVWGFGRDDIWIVAGFASQAYHWDGAVWTPSDTSVRRVWGAGPGELWGVGRAGTIQRWSGSSWATVPLSHPGDLWGVWGTSTSNIFFAGDGGIFRWDGTSVKQVHSSDVALHAVWMDQTARNGWAVGRNGKILRSQDGGASWAVDSSPATAYLYDVAGTAADDVWVVGGQGTVLHWDGTRWTVVPSSVRSSLVRIHIYAQDDIWFSGEGGTLLRRNGQVIERKLGGRPSLHGIWGSAPDNLWAVGNGGSIYHYDGSSWTPSDSGVQNDLHSIWGSGPEDLWIVGTRVLLQGDGKTWRTVDVPATPEEGSDVWGSDRDNVLVGLRNGSVLIWNGVNWSIKSTGLTQSVYDIDGTDRNNIWLLGNGSECVQWDGVSWQDRRFPTTAYLYPRTLKVFSRSDVWAAIGTANPYRWNGTAWTTATPTGLGLQSVIWGTGSDDLWLGGSAAALTHFDGSDWTASFNGVAANGVGAGVSSQIWRIWGLDSRNVWLVGDGGVIMKKKQN